MLAATSSDQIKSSRSLVHHAAQTASIDSNRPASGLDKSAAVSKRRKSLTVEEPIIKSLHILQRGGLTRHARSGFCQGGLTSAEVVRKLEMQ